MLRKSGSDKGVKMSAVSAQWTEDQTDLTLRSVTLDVASGQLGAIIGPVGSGKVRKLYQSY